MIRKHSPHSEQSNAFTLVELIVVAAILVVVSSISFPNLVRFYEAQKLRQAAIELQSHLRRGRSLAQRLQSNCEISISSGATVLVTGSGSCNSTTLPSLNLSQLVGVRGLCIRNSNASNCTTPTTLSFLPLGVLAGSSQTLYLAGSATPAQACLDLNLTLIRVGFRPGSSGACTYSRS